MLPERCYASENVTGTRQGGENERRVMMSMIEKRRLAGWVDACAGIGVNNEKSTKGQIDRTGMGQ